MPRAKTVTCLLTNSLANPPLQVQGVWPGLLPVPPRRPWRRGGGAGRHARGQRHALRQPLVRVGTLSRRAATHARLDVLLCYSPGRIRASMCISPLPPTSLFVRQRTGQTSHPSLLISVFRDPQLLQQGIWGSPGSLSSKIHPCTLFVPLPPSRLPLLAAPSARRTGSQST